ncbi:glycosyl hydrolase [Cellulomonas cellasea]|nr:glycosyl hydrolase [Cellulomonas cellasea]
MTGRRSVLIALGVLVAGVLVVATAMVLGGAGPRDVDALDGAVHVDGGDNPAGPPDAELPQADPAALVAGVEHADAAKLDPVRLADGLTPPTNRWFSGLVFGEQPQPVFALPTSFALTGSGFEIGLPQPETSEKLIIGGHVPAVTVDAAAARAQVSAYDAATVTVELLDAAGQPLGRVVLAQGSPYVSFTAAVDTTLTLGAAFAPATDGLASSTVRGVEWMLSAPRGALADTSVRLLAGQSTTWFPVPADLPSGGLEALALAAVDPVVGSEVAYGVGDGIARTTIAYRTAAGSQTVHATMPHHRQGEQPSRERCNLGSYPSVYGSLELCLGSQLTSWAPVVEAAGELDLASVPDDRRAAIVAQLAADVAATPPFPSDTYFGGKSLYRAATLVTLGRQLGADDVVAPLRAQTLAALREWTEPDGCARRDARCFVYDENARGVVGLTPSFGSEEFNDHHFHYGYFLATAGLLAADDPALAAELAPVLDLLAQDVAAAEGSEWFPQLRAFDVYAGHAWASGPAPFADGNNQESSSEAVTAWNGLGLWAAASGQDALGVQAAWLASTEAASTRAYWTSPDLADPVYDGFGHHVMALNWGGKRDYATWFSPDPAAMLAIQLIPMSPVAGYLVQGDADEDARAARIIAQVEEATPGGFDVKFGDYLLMYLAMAGPDEAGRAWEAAPGLSDTSIDDGSSRAYLLAFVASVASGSGPGSSGG